MSVDETVPEPPAFPGRRWLLPSAVIHEFDPAGARPGRRPRRTARDWLVDFSCFLLAVFVGLLAADGSSQRRPGKAGGSGTVSSTLTVDKSTQ